MPGSATFYRAIGPTTYEPSGHVSGAWRSDEQHMAPVAGLLVHAMQTEAPRPDLTLCRVSFDIFGVIGLATSEVSVEVIRPGRTVELVQASLAVAGRTAVRATGWRLAPSDTSEVAAGAPEPLPPPERFVPWPESSWSGGYIAAIEVRVDPAAEPGRVRAWLRSDVQLVAGASGLARYLGLVDTMNGIGARADINQWVFPNVDLTVHLHRTPTLDRDGWVGLDVVNVLGAGGIGLTTAVLHDRIGAVGRAEQILTVRRRPG